MVALTAGSMGSASLVEVYVTFGYSSYKISWISTDYLKSVVKIVSP